MYGAKGIAVDPRWNVFDNFLSDMGVRPSGTTIDRIDSTKGYFKDNCRWATRFEQQQHLKNNVNITFRGRTQCITAWAREIDIDPMTLRYRLKQKWPLEKVFSPPSKKGRKKKAQLPLSVD